MESDRVRWNQRYREGAYVARTHPTALLEEWLKRLPHTNALDLACGSGRNARFIAQSATHVTGIDISDVAIAQARDLASNLENVEFIVADLDDGLSFEHLFDLIVMVRYVNFELMRTLPKLLVPGGVLFVEEHLRWDDPDLKLAGPKNPDYRTKAGTVARALSSLEPLHTFEGLVTDPLGEVSALAQFIGRKN
ncbi:MAG: class I SAM-dependent methyltransferase [Gammaproteobacteria bacterium]|nr:class I SAM-dependent methyltransferase [Gammaproteobacteria bacterium]